MIFAQTFVSSAFGFVCRPWFMDAKEQMPYVRCYQHIDVYCTRNIKRNIQKYKNKPNKTKI